MEEVPIYPNKSTPETESQPADPEKIGDLLLRYELPNSEPVHAVSLAAEQNPKLIISRDKLRDRLGRFKELNLSRTNEQAAEPNQPEQLTETHFERRHEIRDETTTLKSTGAKEVSIAVPGIVATTPVASVQIPPAIPPPFMPPQKPFAKQSTYIAGPKTYKKPLILGLVAGTITAVILIAVYFS